MPRGKVRYPDEFKAIEAYYVLLKKQRPSRSYPVPQMLHELSDPNVYKDFLKLCMEGDSTEDLVYFRQGLLFVLKAIGISSISRKTGLSRVSIYRMLSETGNPELKSLIKLLKTLGMRLWTVDKEFIYRATPARLNQIKIVNNVSTGRHIKRKINFENK